MDTVIAACGGSMRAAIRALIIANEYLNAKVERLRVSQPAGCVWGSNRVAHPIGGVDRGRA